MPETLNGRQKIKAYLSANDISIASLATMYGMSKQDLSDYLAGRKKNPKANQVILKIISAAAWIRMTLRKRRNRNETQSFRPRKNWPI